MCRSRTILYCTVLTLLYCTVLCLGAVLRDAAAGAGQPALGHRGAAAVREGPLPLRRHRRHPRHARRGGGPCPCQ